MPKYLVPITRECTETTYVDVTADSVEEAVAEALSETFAAPYNFEWVPDDCSGDSSEPYFAGDNDWSGVQEIEP